MNKIIRTIALVITAFAVAVLTACVPADEPGTAADRAVTAEQSQTPESAPVEPEMTAAQKNAVGSASGYLDFGAFSRKGLIKQLKFEGFSKKDARFAVNFIHPNYKVQATKAAKDYLKFDSFSRSGLIQQLEFEGYTRKQAKYGVNKTGL